MNAEASYAILHSLLYWKIWEVEIEIDVGHGEMRVTDPETGIFKVCRDKMMLHVTDYRFLFTWYFPFQFLDAVWFSFVITAVCYEFEAEVFVKIMGSGSRPGSINKIWMCEGGSEDREA